MKRKKLAIFLSLISVFTLVLVMIPMQGLNAVNGVSVVFLDEGGSHSSFCGTNEHSIKYNVQDGEWHTYQLDESWYKPPGWNSSSRFYKVEFKNVNGDFYSIDLIGGCWATGVSVYTISWCSDSSASVYDPCGCSEHDIVWIKFYYTGDSNADCKWIRDRDMVCKTVWVNEDNNFEFIFDYYYLKNNWVKIYDMDGNMVWETNFAYGKNRFEVDLPDGMYRVKIFHNDMETPLQEFIIGKP